MTKVIKLWITDFDGTLADTFEANFQAYSKAFEAEGLSLSREKYRECFGYRFDRFMDAVNVTDDSTRQRIKALKADLYPTCFESLTVNKPLLEALRAFRRSGGVTAVASTARETNLLNALRYIGAVNDFDLILAGEDVTHGKPNPEIYLTVLRRLGVQPSEAMIFEDSAVGFEAAEAAGVGFVKINKEFFGNED